MLKPIAAFVTLIACAMAGVAAWDRGGTLVDRTLLVAISVVIVLAVHLLPGISKRPVTWLIWSACLFAAIYGHLSFITYASQRAAISRANESAVTVGTQQQIEAVKSALNGIQARPIAIIAAELAEAEGWKRRSALKLELDEAKRAEQLKLQLASLYATATTARTTVLSDPVIARVSAISGLPEAQISIGIGLMLSVLVELVGALLWNEALKSNINSNAPVIQEVAQEEKANNEAVTKVMATITGPADPVALVRYAITTGKCKVTVASIREFLHCSQEKAMAVRREVLVLPIAQNAKP